MLDPQPDVPVDSMPNSNVQAPPPSQSSGATSSKLRDSCDACAFSKVKCPKEKPSCSRCESRGIACRYFFTKRPGRKRQNNLSQSTSASTNSNPDVSTGTDTDSSGTGVDTIQVAHASPGGVFSMEGATPLASLSGSNSYLSTPPPTLFWTSPRPDDVSAADASDIFSAITDISMSPTQMDMGSDVNGMDLFMSTIDPSFGLPVVDSTISQAQNDIMALLIPDKSGGMNFSSDTSSVVDPLSASGASSLSSHDLSVPGDASGRITHASDPSTPHHCVSRALDLLKMLSSSEPSHCASSTSLDSMVTSNAEKDGPAQAVLMENKQTIEAVNGMLACSCAEDTFLLTIFSMIVLKILRRYASAAWSQPGTAGGGRGLGQEDEYLGPMPAQVVLGELHRVQRLVNQLSPRLKGSKEGKRRHSSPARRRSDCHYVTGSAERIAREPFSGNTLDQVESDLRKSLSTLSAEIINRLRQS